MISKHFGVITDNNDPEKRGRVSVQCPTIAGDVLEWVEPSFFFVDSEMTAGAFFVPNIGSLVEVEIFEGEGDGIQDLSPKWACSIYPADTIPEEFKEHYPKRFGWKTKSGHLFYFDDYEDDKVFMYQHPTGSTISVNNSGRITLQPASGQSVYVGGNATDPMVKGTELKTFLETIIGIYNGHTHASVGSPPVAPLMPVSVPATVLSTYHKVE